MKRPRENKQKEKEKNKGNKISSERIIIMQTPTRCNPTGPSAHGPQLLHARYPSTFNSITQVPSIQRDTNKNLKGKEKIG